MVTFETSFPVRYAETDRMGIVYHANYYVWFEVGRNELLKSAGLPYWEIESQGVFLPVVKGFCRYRRPARFGDTVVVKTRVEELRAARIRLSYEVYRQQDNTLLAEGYTEHGFVDGSGKPINLRKGYPRIWEILHKLKNLK